MARRMKRRRWRRRVKKNNPAGSLKTRGTTASVRRPLNCRRLSASMERKVNVLPASASSNLPPTPPTPRLAHPSPLSVFPPVTPSDSVVRRSISQQKSGVSVTIDDPVRTTRQPSPPHGKVSNIIHVTNLVGLLDCWSTSDARLARGNVFRKKRLILSLMRAAALHSVQTDISRTGFYWTAPVLRDEACCGDSSENHITVIPHN